MVNTLYFSLLDCYCSTNHKGEVRTIKGIIASLLQGFGFIESGDVRYFFHKSDVVQRHFSTLEVGEKVTFDIESSDIHKPRAANIITYKALDLLDYKTMKKGNEQ